MPKAFFQGPPFTYLNKHDPQFFKMLPQLSMPGPSFPIYMIFLGAIIWYFLFSHANDTLDILTFLKRTKDKTKKLNGPDNISVTLGQTGELSVESGCPCDKTHENLLKDYIQKLDKGQNMKCSGTWVNTKQQGKGTNQHEGQTNRKQKSDWSDKQFHQTELQTLRTLAYVNLARISKTC